MHLRFNSLLYKTHNLLKKQVKKLCPKTKKIGLILDKKIPKKYTYLILN